MNPQELYSDIQEVVNNKNRQIARLNLGRPMVTAQDIISEYLVEGLISIKEAQILTMLASGGSYTSIALDPKNTVTYGPSPIPGASPTLKTGTLVTSSKYGHGVVRFQEVVKYGTHKGETWVYMWVRNSKNTGWEPGQCPISDIVYVGSTAKTIGSQVKYGGKVWEVVTWAKTWDGGDLLIWIAQEDGTTVTLPWWEVEVM